MTNSQQVSKIYRSVIEEVIKNAREYFLNEGVDEQVLQELKQIWESKLLQSRAVDGISGDTQQVQRPTQYLYPHTAAQQQLAPTPNLQQQQQQRQHQHIQQQQQQHVNTVTITPSQINITQAQAQQLPVVRVPERVTAQQANSGQTAILFPHQGTAHATHAHAIPDMTPAAAAATMAAIPGMQQVRANPAGVQYQPNYPHVKTIQTTQHVQQLHHQQVRTSQDPNSQSHIIQVDGAGDSDSDDDDDDDEEEGDEANDHALEGLQGEIDPEEDDPLNSEDDVSDEEDPVDLFDTDNVVVCQFDKIARSRNKWKFHLKDGIMNLKGKDFVFQKAVGEAEW